MYDRMVSAILDHRLPPGTKLVGRQAGGCLRCPRTRVRPQLVRLANEQVVTLTPNRGASIAQPTPQEALEVFEARRLLEPRLVELFTPTPPMPTSPRLRTCIDDEEAAAPVATCAAPSASRATFTCTLRAGRRAPDAGAHPARAGLAHRSSS